MSAQTPEGRITAKIIAWLNTRPMTTAHKVTASPMNRRGEPDIDAVSMGRAIKLEVKVPGTEHAITTAVTPLQRQRLLDYANAGAIVGVVTSVDDVRALLDVEPDRHTQTGIVRARMATIARLHREAAVGSSA